MRRKPPCILWPVGPKAPVLDSDSLHVWCADLDDPDCNLEDAETVLSEDERTAAGRRRFRRDRRRYTAGRLILRKLLSKYTGIDPAEIAFHYGPHGKPSMAASLNGPHELQFNLSHSGGFALYGFVMHGSIGIDIERIQPLRDLRQIAHRFFSPIELNHLLRLPPEQCTAEFFQLWSRKEARAKCIGEGLDEAMLSQTDPGFGASPETAVLQEPTTMLKIINLQPVSGYAAALATERSGCVRQFWSWSTADFHTRFRRGTA